MLAVPNELVEGSLVDAHGETDCRRELRSYLSIQASPEEHPNHSGHHIQSVQKSGRNHSEASPYAQVD